MNEELKHYFDILCNYDYPYFIDKYINTNQLKRLKGIGQFCGCDYNKLYNIRFFYTRLDHSIATALITWNFTKSKQATLAALFHDIGTPVFSHCVDFMLDDTVNQELSEKDVFSILIKDQEILNLLKNDNILLEDVINVKDYSIAENKSPKLCADRLEGVLHTAFIWLNKYSLKDIQDVYKAVTVLIDEHEELGFINVCKAEKFFDMVYDYAIELQKNEDQFTMRFIGDALNYLLNNKLLTFDDLYTLSESDVIKIFEKHITLWNDFTNLEELFHSDEKQFYERLSVKKRFVNPLCFYDNDTFRLNQISLKARELTYLYNEFDDSKYYKMKKLND